MKRTALGAVLRASCVGVVLASASSGHAMLLGVDWDSGNLYQVSTTDASLTLVGSTGVSQMASLEFAPDGTLYGFTAGAPSRLYAIDPATATAAFIAEVAGGIEFVAEGALVFAPDGTAYGTNMGTINSPELFRLDLTTGATTLVGIISGGMRDINGLAWRSDGMLVALDRAQSELIAIDPASAVASTIGALPFDVGAVGGMAAAGDAGFFATASLGAVIPGSNRLYAFDLHTGNVTEVGPFLLPAVRDGAGLSGLAIPEPGTLGFLAAGAPAALFRRRRH